MGIFVRSPCNLLHWDRLSGTFGAQAHHSLTINMCMQSFAQLLLLYVAGRAAYLPVAVSAVLWDH